MKSLDQSMQEYHAQLKKGSIQPAYRGLMEYMASLRTRLQEKYPDYAVSGSIYQGYMDMTYFALTPQSLKERGLKIAVVFVHEAFRFEVWLAANNKQLQKKYWELLKERGWDKYPLVPTTDGADAILEHVLVENPDFGDLDALTAAIETETMRFIAEVETFVTNA